MENSTQIQLVSTFGKPGPEGIIDVDTNAQFAIDFAVSDITEPFRKQGVKSYKFKIIGSKEVNQLLNHYYDINITSGTYNNYHKQKVVVLRNGVIVLDNAYMQLFNINKTSEDDIYSDQSITYEVEVGNDATSFFTEITNKYLTDLDFSDFTHIYSAANVVASFPYSSVRDNDLGTGGYKYVLPYTTENHYALVEARPAISVYEYWNRIHQAAGYQWEWNGYDSDTIRMDRLWIPYNGDTPFMSGTLQSDYEVAAEVSAPFTLTSTDYVGGGYPVQIPSTQFIADNEILDALNIYNPTLGQYTAPFNTSTSTVDASFKVTYAYKLDNTTNPGPFGAWIPGAYSNQKHLSYISVYNTTTGATSALGTIALDVFQNGGPSFTTWYNLPSGITTISSGTSTFTIPVTGVALNDILETRIGVQVSVNASGASGTVIGPGTWRNTPYLGTPVEVYPILEITSIEMIILPRQDLYGFGSPINMNDFVPRKIKQSDFVKAISNMYNLIVDIDPTNDRKIIYTSRDTYYDSGAEVIWTEKLVTDKQSSVSFISNTNAKKVVLTYKPDTDAANVQYLQETKEIYGQQEYILTNENIKGVENKEILFSPTPIGYSELIGTYNPIWPAQAPKTNIRILLDGGVQTTVNPYYIVDYTQVPHAPEAINVNGSFTGGIQTGGGIPITGTISGSVSGGVVSASGLTIVLTPGSVVFTFTLAAYPGITFEATTTGAVGAGTYNGTGFITAITTTPPVDIGEFNITTYPMLTHLDNPDTPQFDINFGLNDKYFFPFTSVTNNNLYSMFWRRTIGQIDSGKLFTGYFMLNEYDIASLKLNDKIFIKDTWYSINTLQYDPNSLGPTRVVLMTIDEELALSTRVGHRPSVPSPGAISLARITREISQENMDALNYNYSDASVKVLGTGNVIPSNIKNSLVIGDYHTNIQSDSLYVETVNATTINANNITLNNLPFTTSLVWERIGDDIQALVADTLVDPNILPANNDVSDLGSSSLRWKDLYLGSKIDVSTVLGISVMGTEVIVSGDGITTAAIDCIPVFISTNNSSIASGVINSVIIGGDNHTMGSGVVNSIIIAGTNSEITTGVNNYLLGFNNLNTLGDNNFMAGNDNTNTSGDQNAYLRGSNINIAGNQNVYLGDGNTNTTDSQNVFAGTLHINTAGTGLFFANTDNTNTLGDYNCLLGVQNEINGGYFSIIAGNKNLNKASGNLTLGVLNENYYSGSVMYSQNIYGSNGLASVGGQTTNATPLLLSQTGTGSDTFSVPVNTAFRVRITVLASDLATGDSKEWEGFGIIKNVAGTTSLVSAITLTSTVGDAGLATASISVVANNTLDTLEVIATGIAATTINWICGIQYDKVLIS